jgi:hypothetical protein
MKGRVLDAGIGLYCRGWVSGHKGRREASLPVCWSCRERASPAGWQPNRAARPEVYHRERAVEVGARGRGSVVAGAMENWPICRGFDRCLRTAICCTASASTAKTRTGRPDGSLRCRSDPTGRPRDSLPIERASRPAYCRGRRGVAHPQSTRCATSSGGMTLRKSRHSRPS